MHATATAASNTYAPTSPLALHNRAASLRRELGVARRGEPVRREAAGATPAAHRASASEVQAVLDALADRRGTRDRVLDRVVDRLMLDLSL